MASYNPLNGGGTNQNVQNKGLLSNMLRNLSNWGMKYDDMISKNRVAVGINEDPNMMKNTSMYDFFSQRAVATMLSRKSVPYLDRAYADKRRILREYSIKDEIKDFVTKVCDESIIYDDEDTFCRPKPLSDEYSQEIKDAYMEAFDRVYNSYGYNDGKLGWDHFRTFLIDGYISFEIVYDDKQQNIIGFEQIDSSTLVPGYEPNVGYIWIQYPEDPTLRRILLDSQIIHVSYASGDEYTETSYVEGLIRPYNQLKIIEQTRIMFNMINATHYQKFTVPIQGLSRQRAEEQISQMIADYSEEIEWDDRLGTVQINGSKHLPYNKQVWFPEGESGTPNLEVVSPEGHDLNESDMLNWFYNILKRASQIPFTRFDRDNGGGNIYSDASEMTRDEAQFSNFISRIRTSFKELLNKPIKLQMLSDFPELKDDDQFMKKIGVEFNSKEIFEEWKRLNNLQKRTEIASSMLSSLQDSEGEPYFHIEWVVKNILKLSEEDKQENEAFFTKYSSGSGEEGEGGDDFGGDDFGGGDDDFGGGDEDFGGGDDADIGGGDDADIGGGDDTGGDTGGDDDFDF
jgi:hypothetical protein